VKPERPTEPETIRRPEMRFPAESVANSDWFAMKILGVISYNLWWFILGIDLIIVELGFDDFWGFSNDWLGDFYWLMMGYFWMLISLFCVLD
jgi:hypothetical protein